MRTWLMGCVLLLAAAASALGQGAKPAAGKTPAPPFAVTSLDGRKISLASLGGKVVVLNFWFTGCQPCVAEIPQLNRLVDEFKGKGVVFLAPTWDDAATARAFLKDVPFKYEVAPGAADVIIGSYAQGGEVVFPTHYVIDRGGMVEFKGSGVKNLDALRAAIRRAAGAHADYRKWLEEDVAYIITDEEKRAFNSLADDASREQFIESFWRRRDPKPETPENEYRAEHYGRVARANQEFASAGVAGWRTDRGRVLIKYGAPDRVQKTARGEVWIYNYAVKGGPGGGLEIQFESPEGGGDLRLLPPPAAKTIF